MNKKNVFIWSLYDFANSFVFITFLLYFSKWLVVNKGVSDWWYNATYIFGSIGLVFFAPWLGGMADKFNKGRRYLSFSTFGCFIFYILAIISAAAGIQMFWTIFCFALGNFFYQLSFVFYNPILNNISNPNNQGKVSGFGFFANYLGQIGGVIISLPFVSGSISLGRIDPLIAPLIPASIIFIALSLPLILKKDIFLSAAHTATAEKFSPIQLFKTLKAIPGVLYFMIAFFLFSDAITTLINNFSIFTSAIFKVSDTQISILSLLIIISGGIGAWLWGIFSDKIGSKKILTTILIMWVFIIPVVALAQSYILYFVFVLIAGLSIGGTFAVSRQMLVSLVSQKIINYSFGIYAISERAATFFGPLAWSAVLVIGGYRMAMLSMVIFLVISVVLIFRVPPLKTL